MIEPYAHPLCRNLPADGRCVCLLWDDAGFASAAGAEGPNLREPWHASLSDHGGDAGSAQRYFNQGMTLSYAFNHAEAIRSFRQGSALDQRCAMCYWGVAYALGPNINAPITPDAAREAYQAIEQARAQAGNVSERERGNIEALERS